MVSPPGSPPTVCVRHPDRATGLACTRCGRPSCPECLRDASVGMQCVDCVTEGRRDVRSARSAAGVALGAVGRRPLVVPVLVAVNVLVYVATALDAGSVLENSSGAVFTATSLTPYLVAGGQWWRLVTSGFLHFGPVHLLANMVALWFIGRDVESALGRLRFTAVYAVSLMGGSAAVMLAGDPRGAVAGASGAVFGLMGALAVLLRRSRRSPGPAVTIIAINVVLSFSIPGISLLAHVGGLVVGGLVTLGLVYGPGRSRPPVAAAVVVGVLLVLVLAVGFRDAALGPVTCASLTACYLG